MLTETRMHTGSKRAVCERGVVRCANALAQGKGQGWCGAGRKGERPTKSERKAVCSFLKRGQSRHHRLYFILRSQGCALPSQQCAEAAGSA
eukprot:1183252-Rhodomonas_salina.2